MWFQVRPVWSSDAHRWSAEGFHLIVTLSLLLLPWVLGGGSRQNWWLKKVHCSDVQGWSEICSPQLAEICLMLRRFMTYEDLYWSCDYVPQCCLLQVWLRVSTGRGLNTTSEELKCTRHPRSWRVLSQGLRDLRKVSELPWNWTLRCLHVYSNQKLHLPQCLADSMTTSGFHCFHFGSFP